MEKSLTKLCTFVVLLLSGNEIQDGRRGGHIECRKMLKIENSLPIDGPYHLTKFDEIMRIRCLAIEWK